MFFNSYYVFLFWVQGCVSGDKSYIERNLSRIKGQIRKMTLYFECICFSGFLYSEFYNCKLKMIKDLEKAVSNILSDRMDV